MVVRWCASHLQQLLLLGLLDLIVFVGEPVGQLLDLLLGAPLLVLTDVAVFLQGAQVLDELTADVADGNLSLFDASVDHLDQAAAPLLRQRRDRQPDLQC